MKKLYLEYEEFSRGGELYPGEPEEWAAISQNIFIRKQLA